MTRAWRAATAALLLSGCGEPGRGAARAAGSASAGVATSASVGAAASAGAVGTSEPPATPEPVAPASPEEGLLRDALVEIRPRPGPLVRRGELDARLASDGGSTPVTLALALSADPLAYRPALAFYRLASGLQARVVPVTALRHLSVGELGPLAERQPEMMTLLREARVQNDGTIDALLAASGGAGGVPVDVEHGREVVAWGRWAASLTPAPGEDSGLLRDYLEMLALDYLSANVVRRRAVLRGGGLVLTDNASAFPPRTDGPSLDRLLRRLRAAQRFPRGLREALLAFDRERAVAAFADGGFETWLLSPRARLELDERRAALLTLIEARIGERGAAAVLSL